MKPFPFFVGILAITAFAFGQPAPSSVNDTAKEEPILLPKMTVNEMILQFPPIPKPQLRSAALKDAFIPPYFPGRALHSGVFEGRATIGVMVDAQGKPTDFLIVRYTEKYFADALLEALRAEPFTPRRVKGLAVPGAVYIGQKFEVETGSVVPMTVMEQAAENVQRILHPDGPPFKYEPRYETEVDSGGLKAIAKPMPSLPAAVVAPLHRPIRVLIQFLVDEHGHVRLPNVQSVPAPELIAPVIEAVSGWQFEPPTYQGKPVLVHALEGLTF